MNKLTANTQHSKITSTHGARVAVDVPADATKAYVSNLSALATVTLDINPVDTKAEQTGTFSDVGTDGDTVVVGATTYTLKDSVGTTAREVLIGATAADTAAALADAINGNTAGGLIGSYTTPHALVTADVSTADVTVTAIVGGTGGNSIATTTTSSDFAWVGATLASGANDDISSGILIPSRTVPVELELTPGSQPTLVLYNSDGTTDAQVNFTWIVP